MSSESETPSLSPPPLSSSVVELTTDAPLNTHLDVAAKPSTDSKSDVAAKLSTDSKSDVKSDVNASATAFIVKKLEESRLKCETYKAKLSVCCLEHAKMLENKNIMDDLVENRKCMDLKNEINSLISRLTYATGDVRLLTQLIEKQKANVSPATAAATLSFLSLNAHSNFNVKSAPDANNSASPTVTRVVQSKPLKAEFTGMPAVKIPHHKIMTSFVPHSTVQTSATNKYTALRQNIIRQSAAAISLPESSLLYDNTTSLEAREKPVVTYIPDFVFPSMPMGPVKRGMGISNAPPKLYYVPSLDPQWIDKKETPKGLSDVDFNADCKLVSDANLEIMGFTTDYELNTKNNMAWIRLYHKSGIYNECHIPVASLPDSQLSRIKKWYEKCNISFDVSETDMPVSDVELCGDKMLSGKMRLSKSDMTAAMAYLPKVIQTKKADLNNKCVFEALVASASASALASASASFGLQSASSVQQFGFALPLPSKLEEHKPLFSQLPPYTSLLLKEQIQTPTTPTTPPEKYYVYKTTFKTAPVLTFKPNLINNLRKMLNDVIFRAIEKVDEECDTVFASMIDYEKDEKQTINFFKRIKGVDIGLFNKLASMFGSETLLNGDIDIRAWTVEGGGYKFTIRPAIERQYEKYDSICEQIRKYGPELLTKYDLNLLMAHIREYSHGAKSTVDLDDGSRQFVEPTSSHSCSFTKFEELFKTDPCGITYDAGKFNDTGDIISSHSNGLNNLIIPDEMKLALAPTPGSGSGPGGLPALNKNVRGVNARDERDANGNKDDWDNFRSLYAGVSDKDNWDNVAGGSGSIDKNAFAPYPDIYTRLTEDHFPTLFEHLTIGGKFSQHFPWMEINGKFDYNSEMGIDINAKIGNTISFVMIYSHMNERYHTVVEEFKMEFGTAREIMQMKHDGCFDHLFRQDYGFSRLCFYIKPHASMGDVEPPEFDELFKKCFDGVFHQNSGSIATKINFLNHAFKCHEVNNEYAQLKSELNL